MKTISLKIKYGACYMLFATLFFVACQPGIKNNEQQTTTPGRSITSKESSKTIENVDSSANQFDVNSIPISTNEIGIFPYVTAPEQYKFNDITKSDLKTVHFAVNGILIPQVGKIYSTNIYKLQESGTPFNVQIVQKYYDDKIQAWGGIKVSSKLLPNQVDKIGKKLLEDEGDHAYTIIGVNDYTLNHLNTYVIKTSKATIWIELSFYQNGGYIYILEKQN